MTDSDPLRWFCQRCDAETTLSGYEAHHKPCPRCGANHWATWRRGEEPWTDDEAFGLEAVGIYYHVTIRS